MTKEKVKEALRECYDPEIPLNVLDLGLIYDIRLDGKKVDIDMTLTAPGCPMHVHIANDIREKVKKLAGFEDVKVNVVWDPPWTPDLISEDGKKKLGFGN